MTYIIKKPQAMISGATFFSVLFFRSYKEKYLAARRRNQYLKKNNDGYINWVALWYPYHRDISASMTSYRLKTSMTIEVLDSRLHENDEVHKKAAQWAASITTQGHSCASMRPWHTVHPVHKHNRYIFATASLSSSSSFCVISILSRLKSSISSPWTIWYSSLLQVTGNE